MNAVHYVDREGSRRSNLAKGKGCDQENLLTEVKEQERYVSFMDLWKKYGSNIDLCLAGMGTTVIVFA